tara:strand:+ start:261 stop:518 length:258 start_codon:yes stop_codon:yes gene_type:complete
VKENIDLNPFLETVPFVENPKSLDWGNSQVQSELGSIITINFEIIKKLIMNGSFFILETVTRMLSAHAYPWFLVSFLDSGKIYKL